MSLQNTSFLDACRGKRPVQTPVWMMRQAGRYLPEYREVRSKVSFLEMCRTPDLCAEVTVQPIDRLGVDAAILFSDILVVFDAMDIKVEFNPSPVIANPVRNRSDLARLRFGDPVEEVQYVMQAVQACKKALNDRVPLIGFCGAPFTILSYLVEGQGSRDFEKTKALLFSDPQTFRTMMEGLTTLLIKYLCGQIAAGVDAVQIFDSWAAALTPYDYPTHVLPHTQRLIAAVKEAAPTTPVILFARGNANLLADSAATTADVVGIDWSIDLPQAIEIVGPQRVIQGNLDPFLLLGSPETLRERTLAMMQAGTSAKSHIANLGHGISRHTDPEMAQLFVDLVHAYRPGDQAS